MGEWEAKTDRREYERAYARKWRAANPTLSRIRIRNSKYKLPIGLFEKLYADQRGLCAVCGQPPNEGTSLQVDHDHKSKKVRGLVCLHCNRGLGFFRDDPTFLFLASVYLERNR